MEAKHGSGLTEIPTLLPLLMETVFELVCFGVFHVQLFSITFDVSATTGKRGWQDLVLIANISHL